MSDEEHYKELEKRYVYGTWRYEDTWNPLVVEEAEGVYFTSLSGRRFLDLSSQLMCSNLGHGNRAVVDAIAAQARKLCYAAPGFATVPAALLGQKLAEIAPGDLSKSFLTNGGSEANEAAIKIARLYTGRSKLVSRYRSYHGSSSGAIALTGDPRTQYAIGMSGVVRAPDCYCYRCPFGKEYPGCGVTCAEYVDEIIRMEGPGTVAGVVIEPIVGSNGILVPPDEYVPRLREICDEHGALLIDDEVMAGFGRTGKMFCIEHWGVVPDIMSMAKGITGAFFPFGATMTTRRIADHFDQPSNLFSHGQTYAMHPLGCAAALAAIKEYEGRDLVGNAARMGAVLGRRLAELAEDHVSVGDVRGKGLFWGVELVRDRESKRPFATREQKFQPNMLKRISAVAMEMGVYMVNIINTLIVAPPLIVTEEEIDEGMGVLDEALKISDAEAV
ncbi:MAG TPA: aminotransferase class III-fold pyridoxal phosphate-dependent enzyme [Patescibacteria group bacterium]|nr:aminotransferase class III-fold pyridoxal phosphate-dependent enzyme [Patescibacteria group bacterium]